MLEALSLPFFQRVLIAGLLASVACGVIGSYVVARRMSSLAGGLAHAAFGGREASAEGTHALGMRLEIFGRCHGGRSLRGRRLGVAQAVADTREDLVARVHSRPPSPARHRSRKERLASGRRARSARQCGGPRAPIV